jgi:hypothetical protein
LKLTFLVGFVLGIMATVTVIGVAAARFDGCACAMEWPKAEVEER